MRLPSLSTGLLVFLLASVLFIDGGEARLGPSGTQGADGNEVQRRRLLEEEKQQVSFSSEDGNVNHSTAEPRTTPLEESPKIEEQAEVKPEEPKKEEETKVKQEEPKIEEETKVVEQAEVKPEELKKEEETKVVEQAEVKQEETKVVVFQEKDEEETKVTDNQKTKVEEVKKDEDEEPMVVEENKDETKVVEEKKKEVENEPEEKSTVQVQGVKENRIESTEEGSKKEEELLAEALVLEEQEEKRVQEEAVDRSKPNAERYQQEIKSAENKPISPWEAKDETKEQEELPQAEVKKEEVQANKTTEESESEEKKDGQLKEDTKTEGQNKSVHQHRPEEKKEAEKSVKKEVSEEKPAEKKVEELKPSSPTEQKVDLQAEEKKSEPIVKEKTTTAKETIRVTSDRKKEELKVEQKQEEVEEETAVKEIKQEDKQDESISADITDSSDADDDYPDFIDEFLRFPERLQESAEHLKTNVPGWEKLSTNSKDLFNHANEQIKESFTPLIGRAYAPVVAYLVSYGLLLLPLGIVMFLFERVRAILSLQKVLLFINIYIAAYFAALVAAAFILGSEPMDFFRNFSPSSYIFLQLLQAFGYIMFIILQTFDLLTTCSSGRFAVKVSAALQWIVVVVVGFHYYVTVFHRAMAKSKPLTSWKVFGLYSISFTILCLFARIERGKKQYIQEGGEGSTKQN